MSKRSSEVLKVVKSRQRWSAQVAGMVLEAASRSGLSLAEFATWYEIEPERLYRWERRFLREACAEEPVTFEEVPVPVCRPPDSVRGEDDRIEVELPTGCIVRVGPSFDEGQLRRLLSVLGVGDQVPTRILRDFMKQRLLSNVRYKKLLGRAR